MDVSRTIKCALFGDALVLGSMLEEHGAQVRRPDDDAPLTMVATGTLDGITAAVAQLRHELVGAGPVVIEGEDRDYGAVNGRSVALRGPATGALDAHEWADPDQLLGFEVVIIPAESRYHRGGCTLIRLLSSDDLETLTRRLAQIEGYVPCRACKPDNPLLAST